MKRVLVAVLGAVAGSLLLDGCSPAQQSLAAVRLDGDGTPVATVRLCDGDHGSRAELSSWPTGDAGASEPTAQQTARRPDFGAEVEVSTATFPLFSPPAAWHTEATGLQQLRPGRTYALDVTGPRSGWSPYDVDDAC
ncbi:hypothetical protein R6V09_06870 [Streptomyces sp. W16]|uniref:hypothetical protein n=1 Tax=Streptomyces sp. W16 TaxID=3076631 RepID=UPI00295AA815|nr:hypothetical protein [Streptomyces sp. W16]MDV9169859.1 hypothetical protein [Streptomyces sp. W16]